MKQLLISFFLLFLLHSNSNSQITIKANGDVSIPNALDIGNPASAYYQLAVKCGSSCGSAFTKYGIYVINENGGSLRYGIDSRSLGTGTNYGIRGYAEFGNINRGVVGAASGSNSYGGYFTNGVYVSGGITQSSDARLKKNIQSLEESIIASKVFQLRPRKFEFLSEDELKEKGLPSAYTTQGVHFGLIAQELEEIFPELVSEVVHDINQDLTNKSGNVKDEKLITTKAINYQELVVLLLAAVQKQQLDLEAMRNEIEILKTQSGNER